MKRFLIVAISLLFIASAGFAKEKAQEKKQPENKGLDVKSFIELKWISDMQLAPNGKYGAYVISEKSVADNSSSKNIWFFSVLGGTPKQLTQNKKSSFSPRWSSDNKTLGFISTRSGSPQIWLIDVTGGEPKQLTDFAAGIDDFIFSPDGVSILFASTVYKECSDDKCVKERDKKIEESNLNVKVVDEMIYRHWDSWLDGKMSRLFLMNINSKETKVITPDGLWSPPMGLGGAKDFAFSPDGKEIAYATNTDKDLSRSTNNDIYIYDVEKGKHTKISVSPSNDNNPGYSPDGKYIAFATQMVPGFESDKTRISIYDRNSKEVRVMTEKLDRSAADFVWAPDSQTIYFTAEDVGFKEVYSLTVADGAIKKTTYKTYNSNIQVAGDGKYMLMFRESFHSPAEIYRKDLQTGKIAKMTAHNDTIMKSFEMGKWEEFNFKGGGGANIHGFIVYPSRFDSGKKYPWVLLIHGGPQGSWDNSFHPRWNSAMFAAPGYVAVSIDFHGSIGYGQDFTNSISKDWFGKPYEDLMLGVDYLLANHKYLHNKNFCAAGGSYGGSMTNWLEAKTDRFKCLISHAGDSDHVSAYGTTEEKWFPEWDYPGIPYDEKGYDALKIMSPIYYAKNFKTPLLILHGALDYRVPLEQAFEMYSAAKYSGVDTKMVIFEEEAHWINRKPKDQEFWWNTMFDWMAKNFKK
jgi:dipeptidyl aminopeptidase/acylaminoacyl peptidase